MTRSGPVMVGDRQQRRRSRRDRVGAAGSIGVASDGTGVGVDRDVTGYSVVAGDSSLSLDAVVDEPRSVVNKPVPVVDEPVSVV